MVVEKSLLSLAMFVQKSMKKLMKKLLVLHQAYQRGSMLCQVIPAPHLRLQVAKCSSCHSSKFLTGDMSSSLVRNVSGCSKKKSVALTANRIE